MREFGGELHILVNNAGYTWDGTIHKMSDEQFQAMLDVHNVAPFRLVRAAAPHMRDAAKREMADGGKAKPRCIINVSSTSGLHGNAGQVNYATAKYVAWRGALVFFSYVAFLFVLRADAFSMTLNSNLGSAWLA